MHDAKAALSMLEGLRVEDELSDDDPGCECYVRQVYDSNREEISRRRSSPNSAGSTRHTRTSGSQKATETDIEHIVAASETHRSDTCLETRAAERSSLVEADAGRRARC